MSVALKKKKYNRCVDEECTQPFSKTSFRSLRLWILVLQILTHSVYKSWNCKLSILIFISSAAAKILVDTKRFWIFDLMAFKFNPWKACSSTQCMEIAQWCLVCWFIHVDIGCMPFIWFLYLIFIPNLFILWQQIPLHIGQSHTDVSQLDNWMPNFWRAT